jgi:hypothetical protein
LQILAGVTPNHTPVGTWLLMSVNMADGKPPMEPHQHITIDEAEKKCPG